MSFEVKDTRKSTSSSGGIIYIHRNQRQSGHISNGSALSSYQHPHKQCFTYNYIKQGSVISTSICEIHPHILPCPSLPPEMFQYLLDLSHPYCRVGGSSYDSSIRIPYNAWNCPKPGNLPFRNKCSIRYWACLPIWSKYSYVRIVNSRTTEYTLPSTSYPLVNIENTSPVPRLQ